MHKQLECGKQAVFDFISVYNEMLATVGGSLQPDRANAEIPARELLAKHREALKTIAELHIQEELSLEEFQSELRDEMMVFNMELAAMEAPENTGLEKSVNAARDVLSKAVMKRVMNM